MNSAITFVIPLLMSCSFTSVMLEGNTPLAIPHFSSQAHVAISSVNIYEPPMSYVASQGMVIDAQLFIALRKVANEISSNTKGLDDDIANAINENFWDLLV